MTDVVQPLSISGVVMPFGAQNPLDNELFTVNLVRIITDTLAGRIGAIDRKRQTAILHQDYSSETDGERFDIHYPRIALSEADYQSLLSDINSKLTTMMFDKKNIDVYIQPYDSSDDKHITEGKLVVIPRLDNLSSSIGNTSVDDYLRDFDNSDIYDAIINGAMINNERDIKSFSLRPPRVIETEGISGTDSRKNSLSKKLQSRDPRGFQDADVYEEPQRRMGIASFMSNLNHSGKKVPYQNHRKLMEELLEIAQDSAIVTDSTIYRLLGEIFYRVYEGDNEGFVRWKQLADDNSIPTKGFDEMYKNFSTTYTTNVTLMEMLIESDTQLRQKFAEWQRDRFEKLLDSTVKFNSYSLAAAVEIIRPFDFVFDDLRGIWYYYEAGVWVQDPRKLRLRNFSTEVLYDFITEYLFATTGDDEDDKKRRTALNKAIDMTRSSTGIAGIVSHLEDRFNIEKITTKMNKKYHTFQVNNGVIEFDDDTKTVNFRPFRREDYAAFKSPVSYIDTYSLDHPDVKEVIRYYEMFMPDPDTRECFLRWRASGMYRGNEHNKKYAIILGVHNNSKTVETTIANSVYGGFSVKGKIALLTNDPQSAGSVDTATNGAEDKSFVTYEEPERGSVIRNTGFVKQTSGADKGRGRGMKEEERDMMITAKINIVTNFYLGAAPGDDALEGRELIFLCKSLWSANAPESEERQEELHHYKIDPDFRSKIKKLLPAFLWYYVYYAKRWFADNKDIKISKEMEEASKKYAEKNDFYTPYLESTYAKSEDGSVDYNTFIKSANDSFLNSPKYKSIYHQDALEKYLKKWLGGSDYIYVADDGKKRIRGIRHLEA